MNCNVIYINGVAASAKALKLLNEHIFEGKIAVQFATTKSGNLNILTYDL